MRWLKEKFLKTVEGIQSLATVLHLDISLVLIVIMW